MLDKNQQKIKEIEAQARFDGIKEAMKKAREEAIEEAENPYRVEASQYAHELYALGLPKEAIHRANRDYQNATRRARLWEAWTPDEPAEDLRSRGKAAREKASRPYEWLDREEWEGVTPSEDAGSGAYVDGIKFYRDNGDVWRFGIVYDAHGHGEPVLDSLDGMHYLEWWSEFKHMRKAMIDEWNERHPTQEDF